MDSEIFDGEYYYALKKLFILFGLWPSLNRFRKIISNIAMVIMPITLIIVLASGLKRAIQLRDVIMIMEDLIGILYFIAVTLKYLCTTIFENRILVVYEQIASDWAKIKDQNELLYLHKKSQEGKLLTLIYLGYGSVGMITFLATPYIPLVLDFINPLNASRPKIYPYYSNYIIIDSEKYFYTIYSIHGLPIAILLTEAAITVDCMFIMMVKHSCGLFQIVSYRLKKIGEEYHDKPYEFERLMDDGIIHDRMKKIFDSHKSSIECVDAIQASFDLSFFFIMGLASLGVGIIVFDLLLKKDDFIQIIRISSMLLGIYLGLFVLCYSSQTTVDSSELVFYDTYFGYWYNVSSKARKYTQMIMMRSMKPCIITAGGVIDMNLQSFVAILKTSLSYTTVMLSMKEER